MLHKDRGQDAESVQLYRLLRWGLYTEAPMTVMFTVMAALTGSAALVAIAIQSGVALVVNGFAVYAMRQVLKENVYSFPYGAGKLENFSAFLCGVLYVPSGLYVMFDGMDRFVHAPDVGYVLSLIPVAISLARGIVLYVIAARMARATSNPSPLLVSYKLDYRIGCLTDGGVMVSFALAWLLIEVGLPQIGDRIDPIVALAISVYMIIVGVDLVRHNFRALIDLPLAEREQMTILRVLAHHYKDYDMVGTVCSRESGKRRFVEIELGFDGDKSVEHVHTLSRHMEKDLAGEMPGLHFRVVPVWEVEEEEFAAGPVGAAAAPGAVGPARPPS